MRGQAGRELRVTLELQGRRSPKPVCFRSACSPYPVLISDPRSSLGCALAATQLVRAARRGADPSLKLTFQISDLDNTDPVESVDAEGNVVEDAAPAYITSSLLITKGAAKKALLFDLGASPDGFEVTNVAIYDRALAEAGGPEGDWKRRSNYMGPREYPAEGWA